MRALHLPDRHQRRMDQAMFHKLKSPTEMRGLFPIMGQSRVFYTVSLQCEQNTNFYLFKIKPMLIVCSLLYFTPCF